MGILCCIFLLLSCKVYYTQTLNKTFDVYIDYFADCTLGCIGNATQPYNRFSSGMTALQNQMKIQNLTNYTIINIHLLGTTYLSTKTESSSIFSNWETQLKVYLIINIMPDACFIYSDCLNKTFSFQLKSENITFVTTYLFTLRRINFDGRDIILNNASSFLQNPCYNSSLGCCNISLMSNLNSDCYLTNIANRTMNRTSQNLNTFLSIGTNTTNLTIQECMFQNFLSQKTTNFYGLLISSANSKGGDKGGGSQQGGQQSGQQGGNNQQQTTLKNLSINIVNSNFSRLYFPTNMFSINRDNTTLYFQSVNIFRYNPYYFKEISSSNNNRDNNNVVCLISLSGNYGNTTFNLSKFQNVQTLVNANTYILIIDCNISLMPVNTTGTSYTKPPIGIITGSTYTYINILRCNFSMPFLNFSSAFNTTDTALSEVSIISLNKYTSLLIMDSLFQEMWLGEATIIFALLYNNITLTRVQFSNIYHICNDIPSLCDFNLFLFSSYNIIIWNYTHLNSFYWTQDKGLINLNTFNNFSIYNSSFFNVTSELNLISMIVSTSYNRFMFRNCSFTDWIIDPGLYFIEFGLYDTTSIVRSSFNSSFFSEVSSFAYLQNSLNMNISFCNFVNITFSLSAFVLSHNVTITLNNCNLKNITSLGVGIIYLADKNSSVKINSSNFVNVSAMSQGGILYIYNLNNIVVFNSTFINCSCINQDGGIFFLNNYNNLSVNSSIFIGGNAYYGGVLSAYLGNILYFYNVTFESTISENNGGTFYLINLNNLTISQGIIYGGSSSNGRGGFILMIIANIFNISKFNISMTSGYAEGGFLYAETSNNIYMNQIQMNSISSQADGGCIFLKESNIFNLTNSTFVNISSILSGGFFNVKNYNQLRISLSSFSLINSNKDGGFAYLEKNNIFNLSSSNINLVSGFTGGFIAGSNLNNLKINDTTITNVESFSTGGIFWFFTSNFINLVNTNLSNVICHGSNGGGAFLSNANDLLIYNCELRNIQSEDSGGLVYLEINNNITILDCILVNLTTTMNGVLALAKVNNTMNFTNNNIKISSYFGLFYFNVLNNLYLGQNFIEILYGKYNLVVFYANSSNLIIAQSNEILIDKSVNPVKFYVFSLQLNNSLSLINDKFTLDKCYTFLEGYESTNIIIQNIGFKGLLTVNFKLFYLENSFFTGTMINFKNNLVLSSIEAVSSTITLNKFSYFPCINFSSFIQSTNSSINLFKGYFYNLNRSTSAQIIIGNNISIYMKDVSFLMIFSSGIQVYDSNITILRSFFGFNREKNNGGIINMNRINVLQYKYSLESYQSIWLRNNAQSLGGCVFFDISSNLTMNSIYFNRNKFILNKAFLGGIVAANKLSSLLIQSNKILKNSAVSSKINLNSKGGAFYLYNLDEVDNQTYSDISISFIARSNSAIRNDADIGGVFYFEGLNFSYYEFSKNKFYFNKANYYGNEFASEIYKVRFYSYTKYLDTLPNIKTDSYKNAIISGIKSGQNYSECLLRINGYDRFGSIAYESDEDFMDKLTIVQKSSSDYSNQFNPINNDGFLCFNGIFQRNQMPLPVTVNYEIVSSFQSALTDIEENHLSLTLEFSICDIGERMTEDFKCIPCAKGSYSFEFKFQTFSDVCQNCDQQNFYCFGGGNYTMKPGHWRMNKESVIIYKCPNSEACIGDPRNYTDNATNYNELYAAGYCEIGYTGILCAECEEDYGFLDGYQCSPCQHETYYLKVFSNLLLRIFFTLYLINISMNMCLSLSTDNPDLSRIIGTNLLKIFTNHLQILGIILNFPITFPSQLVEFSGYLLSVSPNVSEAFSIECILKKIPINISLQYFKLVVAGIYPLCLVLLYLLFISLIKNYKASVKKKHLDATPASLSLTNKGILLRQGIKYKDLILTTFALVTLTCYADICKMTLAMFGCVDLGDGKTSTRVLFTDFRIDCDGTYHKTWIKNLASPVLVFFLFFYPIYIIFNIMRGVKTDEKNKIFRFKFGYFFYAYKRKFFFWDFVILARKLVLIFINSFFFSRITETIPYYPIVLVLFMMSLAYILQVNIKPWQNNDFQLINKLEEFSLVVSNLSIILSLFFLSYTGSSDSLIIFLLIFMLLLNISFFIAWIYFYYKHYLKKRFMRLKWFRPKKDENGEKEKNSVDLVENGKIEVLQIKIKNHKREREKVGVKPEKAISNDSKDETVKRAIEKINILKKKPPIKSIHVKPQEDSLDHQKVDFVDYHYNGGLD